MSEPQSTLGENENLAIETTEKTGVAGEVSRSNVARMPGVAQKRSGNRRVIAIAFLAAVALISVALVIWRFSRSRVSGRPVPAPRSVATDQQSSSAADPTGSSEDTIVITPDAVASAGIKVEVIGSEPSGSSGTNTSTGVVKANTYRESPVISLVTGIVREVNVELGQYVKASEQVAMIVSDELATAQNRYLTAIAMLDEHNKHHRRTIDLVEVGSASREELEQANTKVRASELEVATLRHRLSVLGFSPERINSLNSTSQVSSYVALAAPISGVVINRLRNPGEIVQANSEIVRVADLSSVWVIAQVYEKDLGAIRIGNSVRVKSAAYPSLSVRGRITYIDPALDPATRTAQVRIEMANPGQRLKIGMYVDVAFAGTTGPSNSVPFVPVAAVQNHKEGQVVFLATATPGVFLMRPVRVGSESRGRVPVLEGLTAGERVVTEGSFLLRAEWLKRHQGE